MELVIGEPWVRLKSPPQRPRLGEKKKWSPQKQEEEFAQPSLLLKISSIPLHG